MINFVNANLGTIIVALVLIAIVTAIVINIVHKKKKGLCASCDGCSGNCHASSHCSGLSNTAKR